MKRGSHSNVVFGAPMALFIVLLGCLAISARCARSLDVGGGIGDDDAAAPVQQPYCYRSCTGYEPCSYCCASVYTPTICWKTQGKCKAECRLPWSTGPPAHRQAIQAAAPGPARTAP